MMGATSLVNVGAAAVSAAIAVEGAISPATPRHAPAAIDRNIVRFVIA
jgi:hypothetical protein